MNGRYLYQRGSRCLALSIVIITANLVVTSQIAQNERLFPQPCMPDPDLHLSPLYAPKNEAHPSVPGDLLFVNCIFTHIINQPDRSTSNKSHTTSHLSLAL